MAVRRDEEGRWRYRIVVKLPNGQKVRVSGTPTLNTKVGAERAEHEHVHRTLYPPPTPAQKKEVPTFEEFVDKHWMPTYPASVGNRPSTVKCKEMELRVHLKPALGSLRLDEIKGEVVDRLFANLRKPRPVRNKGLRVLSPKSIKNIRATLRRVLVSAVEWEFIDKVPALPKVKVPDKGWDHFTAEESEKLIEAARDDEERALLVFPLRTGCRAGEQLGLRWGDINWHTHEIVFRRSSTGGQVGPTKSGKERRVPMTEGLERALRKMKHLRGELVFCRLDGKPLTIWQLHEKLWGACRRAGLRKIRWHDLRHSFASQLVTVGVPIRRVQDWLGHSTIAMTMRYAHLAPGSGSDLIRALEDPSAVAKAWQTKNAKSQSEATSAG
ncbi:MAG TPA: tyrosine-type recombinase/integrase [Polyangia bacterium]